MKNGVLLEDIFTSNILILAFQIKSQSPNPIAKSLDDYINEALSLVKRRKPMILTDE